MKTVTSAQSSLGLPRKGPSERSLLNEFIGIIAVAWINLCIWQTQPEAFAEDTLSLSQRPALSNDTTFAAPDRKAAPILVAPDSYQREALKLLIQEANQVARELALPELLPITETNLVGHFILPLAGAQSWQAVGKIVTRNYAYYVSRQNKFCFLERMHNETEFRQWQKQYLRPVNLVDTNRAYQLAERWLSAVSIDVRGLNRDCRVHIVPSAPIKKGTNMYFLPIYWVYWTKPGEGRGSVASVQLFAPTETLMQLRVEDPKYILRKPLVFTNLDVLLTQTNTPAVTNAHANP